MEAEVRVHSIDYLRRWNSEVLRGDGFGPELRELEAASNMSDDKTDDKEREFGLNPLLM